MEPTAAAPRGGLGKLAAQYIGVITVVFLLYLMWTSRAPAPTESSYVSEEIETKPQTYTPTHAPATHPPATHPTATQPPTDTSKSTIGWGLRKCPQDVVKWDASRDEKAQLHQDTTVYNKYFKNKCFGTFLEMGALNGEQFSNSWFFEKVLGWRGVCVEPNPTTYKQLIQNRPLCIDVNAAVTSTRGPLKFMQVVGYSEALSGIFDAYDPKHVERIKQEVAQHGGSYSIVDIPGIPLHELLEENGITHVDFFSLDTEGSELLILKGVHWDKVSIDLIMVENNYETDEVKVFLEGVGYEMVDKLGPDEVFQKKK
jgi:FkbM family methyltransferase